MPQSLAQIYVHLVFSTKDRRPFLLDVELRNRIHAYLAGACHNLGSPATAVGGVEDHVHALVRLGRTVAAADLVRDLKKESSKWIKEQSVRAFGWQSGYGAFSVSPSHVPALHEYIASQEDHHRTVSFQDEFRRLCAKYGIEIDERYVWD